MWREILKKCTTAQILVRWFFISHALLISNPFSVSFFLIHHYSNTLIPFSGLKPCKSTNLSQIWAFSLFDSDFFVFGSDIPYWLNFLSQMRFFLYLLIFFVKDVVHIRELLTLHSGNNQTWLILFEDEPLASCPQSRWLESFKKMWAKYNYTSLMPLLQLLVKLSKKILFCSLYGR